MALDLVFKDVKPTEELKERLKSKLEKIERILNRPPPVRFTLTKTKGAYTCNACLNVNGQTFVAEGSGEDLFTASDEAVHRLEAQVTNERKRLVQKRQGRAGAAGAGA